MDINTKWILDGKKAVAVDLMTWAKWYETSHDQRRVAEDVISGKRISTVFLGTDHNFADDGPPLIFETMVFEDGDWDELYCDRYASWDEAEAGHAKAIDLVKTGTISAH